MAQRKRAGPITQRSMDRNHPLLGGLSNVRGMLVFKSQSGTCKAAEACFAHNPDGHGLELSSVMLKDLTVMLKKYFFLI